MTLHCRPEEINQLERIGIRKLQKVISGTMHPNKRTIFMRVP